MTKLDFISLGRLLLPEASEEDLNYGIENEWEWMELNLPLVPYSLNVSREHGGCEDDLANDSQIVGDEPQAKPGPVHVFGWDNLANTHVLDDLPDTVATYISDRLRLPVEVYAGKVNAPVPEIEPIETVEPRTPRAE